MKDEYFSINDGLYYQDGETGLIWYVGADKGKKYEYKRRN